MLLIIGWGTCYDTNFIKSVFTIFNRCWCLSPPEIRQMLSSVDVNYYGVWKHVLRIVSLELTKKERALMKRDLNLVKEILKAIEKQKGLDFISAVQLEIEGCPLDEVIYNIELMGNAGLLEVERLDFMGGEVDILIHNITWEGHDFLDAAKNDTVWNQVEENVKEQGGKLKELPFEVAKGLLVSFTKKLFDLK